MRFYSLRHLIVLAAVCLTLAARVVSGVEPPKKVLVLPFTMNTAQDMTYLQQGLLDMLTSRLVWADKVIVLPKAQARVAFEKVHGKVDESTAQGLGRSLGADYVLFGSVTVLGQNVSLDARMIALKEPRPPLTVFAQSKGMDGVIPKINEFADNINVNIFGRPARTQAARPRPTPEAKGPVPAYRRHPDYLLTGREGPQAISPLSPYIIASKKPGYEEGFWRSPSFPFAMVGLDVGDLDGDGRNELVYASRNAVYAARIENDRLVRIAKYTGHARDRFLSIDVADINGNGAPEIFVSNQSDVEASSVVLELKNGRLKPIVSDSPWYYRIIQSASGSDVILLGQRGGTTKRFFEGVKVMRYSGGRYVPKKSMKLPEGINLFNFAIANLTGTGKESMIVVNESENLVLMSRGGQDLWTGSEDFASTMNYMLDPFTEDRGSGPDSRYRPRLYIPARILTADLNGDGKREIIVPRNKKPSVAGVFQRLRSFTRCSIYSLSYNQMALRENWHSRELPGFIADYSLKDYNSDKRPDLVLALVLKYGRGIKESRSTIIAYRLATPEEIRKAEEERRRQDRR